MLIYIVCTFPRATGCGLLECSPHVFSHFCPSEQHRSFKSRFFFSPTNPKGTHSQTQLTRIVDHHFSTQLQCKKYSIKQQSFPKIHKKNKSRNQKRDRIQREIKVQQVLLRRKDIISCFAFSFIQMCVCQSVVVCCCEAVRLQDARRGEAEQAAVPRPQQQGQQRGQARGPPGHSRVLQDGVGCTRTVYLGVLRDRRGGTGWTSSAS